LLWGISEHRVALPNLILTEPTSSPPAERKRRPFRPPVGMPGGRTRWRLGSVVSALIHFTILWLILRETNYGGLVTPIEQGAGGPGPAGGGGGRSARVEVIQYVAVAPAPPPQPKPTLVFKPPEIKQLPTPAIEPLKISNLTAPSIGATPSADPSLGSGPGSGGGVGTGTGTGRGSANGPGTGGGDQANFPPTTDQMFLPPFPVPNALKGKSILAEFDIDERGKIVGLVFTETGDRSYDRRLTEVFKAYRFRAGHKPDGTPVRMKFQMKLEL
jgi:protein TonB